MIYYNKPIFYLSFTVRFLQEEQTLRRSRETTAKPKRSFPTRRGSLNEDHCFCSVKAFDFLIIYRLNRGELVSELGFLATQSNHEKHLGFRITEGTRVAWIRV